MPIDVLIVALVGGTALLLAVWHDIRRSVEPDGPRPVATDSTLEAEQKRLADLKAELGAAETRTAQRERQISARLRELTTAERAHTEAATELARQGAALAQRERDLDRSLADAERSAAEARARIEAREAVITTREAGLQQQESELADRHRSVAEHERELIRARAGVRAREEGLGAAEADLKARTDREKTDLEQREERVAELEDRRGKNESDLGQCVGQLQTQTDWNESDWWEKQLGRPLSANT
jgi:chromosome segregation ATPase